MRIYVSPRMLTLQPDVIESVMEKWLRPPIGAQVIGGTAETFFDSFDIFELWH